MSGLKGQSGKVGLFRENFAIIGDFAKKQHCEEQIQERWMSGLSRTPGKRV
jgi:hypothetical protein